MSEFWRENWWFVILLLAIASILPALFIYDTYAEAPNAHRAWIARCVSKGATPVPTERWQVKGQDRYSGWVCAKLVRIEP